MINLNNNADPNNNPGPGYVPAPATTGTSLIGRRGPITHFRGPSALTGSVVYQFDTILNQGWTVGDLVFVAVPTHTGGGFTTTVNSIAAAALATYAALLANGGLFLFTGTDFVVLIAGNSTT